MQYDLGLKYIRKNYIERQAFLSAKYNADEIYVQTTSKSRTIESANAQLDGLFSRELTFPFIDPIYYMDVIPAHRDYSMHLDKNICKRFS